MDVNIKLFLVDNDEIFRNGIKRLIDSEPDIELAGQAGNGETALDHLLTLRPDVIIMAIRLPGANGIETGRLLLKRDPQAKILFFTGYDNPDYVVKALEIGARGYILKAAGNKILLDAIRQVHQGKFYFTGDVSDVLVRRYLHLQNERASATTGVTLSKREEQILRMINRHLSNKEIAEALRVSVRTIEAHRLNILRKFQASNMEEVLTRLDPDIDPLSVEGPGKEPV